MNKDEYIYGKNPVKAALEQPDTVRKVYLSDTFSDQTLLEMLRKYSVAVEHVKLRQLDQWTDNGLHQGIVAMIKPFVYAKLETVLKQVESKKQVTFVLLDGIEDPHNFGAIIRSADALGVDAILLPSVRSVTVTPTVVKVSTGATHYVPVVQIGNPSQTLRQLKDAGFWVVASDGSANQSFQEVDYNMRVVLILGSEGKGIHPLVLKQSDFITKIPMVGHVNSLNVSVAAALYFQEIASQRIKGEKK